MWTKKRENERKRKKNWSKVTRENISVLFFSRYSYKIPLKSERMTGNVNYYIFFLFAFFSHFLTLKERHLTIMGRRAELGKRKLEEEKNLSRDSIEASMICHFH